MEITKRQYHAPVFVDQGSVVGLTMATCKGQCWDGSPNTKDDLRLCSATEEASLLQ